MEKQVKKLLIADDMEVNRAILKEIFQDEYQILEAEDGRQAVDCVIQNPQIDALLLDMMMPVMDGIAVLREFKKRNYTDMIPVILITSETDESRLLLGYDLGIADIISKPFSPAIVRRRVKNTVKLFRYKQQLEQQVYQQTEALEKTNRILQIQAQKLKDNNEFIIDALSTMVEFRNGESGAHIRRMRKITAVLLNALSGRYEQYRMTPERIETIASAATMHDIGKIAIPDAVLLKPGKLTSAEFEIMKTHTIRGCALLESLHYNPDDEYYGYCYEICRHHHERWNGKGYPDGLIGMEIPIWAQVVSIADVYEALISQRVYKSAYSHDQAIRMIVQGECGMFNPELLQCFLLVAGELHRELMGQSTKNTC